MYNGIATLKSNPVASYDTYGNEVVTYTDKEVFVTPRGVFASEFYQAAQLGIQPEITLVISNKIDYSGEKLLEYEGKMYDVVRADWANRDASISLICAERVGNNA